MVPTLVQTSGLPAPACRTHKKWGTHVRILGCFPAVQAGVGHPPTTLRPPTQSPNRQNYSSASLRECAKCGRLLAADALITPRLPCSAIKGDVKRCSVQRAFRSRFHCDVATELRSNALGHPQP